MSRQVIKDYNDKDDEAVVKSLRKPVHNHVISSSTQTFADEDVSSLNDAPTGSGRPLGDREAGGYKADVKKTLLGNEGPDAAGKIDFSKSPDSLDALVQYHESYKNPDTDEGFAASANKCFRQFNRLFSTKEKPCKVTEAEIAAVLKNYYAANPNPQPKQASVTSAAPARAERVAAAPSAPVEEKVTYTPLPEGKALKVVLGESVAPLIGDKYEICKILNCKAICVVQKLQGTIETNGLFFAACGNTDPATRTIPDEKCPQQAPLSAKEKMAFEMFKIQFGGDELKAKKFLYMTKTLYK